MKLISERIEEFKQELADSGLMQVFEFEVQDAAGEQEYILFYIEFRAFRMIATHIALTREEESSDKIAFQKVDIEIDQPLYYHLEGLLEECRQAITESTLYDWPAIENTKTD